MSTVRAQLDISIVCAMLVLSANGNDFSRIFFWSLRVYVRPCNCSAEHTEHTYTQR